ncbi:hypothetical protein EDB84DRAFT_1566108 [Lactarius hengduanensis]|nr:hypothetical protein EDB84DRAFT_1566108 [Lactarius hengduanensis]
MAHIGLVPMTSPSILAVSSPRAVLSFHPSVSTTSLFPLRYLSLPPFAAFKFPRHPSDPTRRLVAIDSLATSPIPIQPPSTHNVYHFSLSRSYTLMTSFQICINSNEVTGRFVMAVVVVVVVAVVVAVVVVTASSRDRLAPSWPSLRSRCATDSRRRGRRCAVVAQPTRAVVAVVAQLSRNQLAPSLRPRRATNSRRRCALVAQPTRALVAQPTRTLVAWLCGRRATDSRAIALMDRPRVPALDSHAVSIQHHSACDRNNDTSTALETPHRALATPSPVTNAWLPDFLLQVPNTGYQQQSCIYEFG